LQKNYLNTEVVVLIIQFIQARNKARNHNSNYLKPKNSQKYFFLSQPKVPKFEAKGARAYLRESFLKKTKAKKKQL
jgi:hypothetical protein